MSPKKAQKERLYSANDVHEHGDAGVTGGTYAGRKSWANQDGDQNDAAGDSLRHSVSFSVQNHSGAGAEPHEQDAEDAAKRKPRRS